jgi:hypothetical protein
MTQFYATTKSAGNWTLKGRIRWENGQIYPGTSPGSFRVEEGNLELAGAVELGMEIGGLTPGTEHDVITQSGGPNGTLKVAFIDRFECEVLSTDRFTLLTSDRPLSGSFTNVASGARLSTTDGSGSFLVEYGPGATNPNHVVLRDFQPVIVPETFAQWASRHALPVGQSGPLDDPNADGLPNIVAYATGLSLVGPAQPSPFQIRETGAGVIVSFLSPKAASGFTVRSSVSADLQSWPAGPVLTRLPGSALKDRFQFSLPLAGGSRQFGRFIIGAQN